MVKPDENYTVLREYRGLYDAEELVRRIIRRHLRDACAKKELPEHGEGEALIHGEYDR